MDFIDYVKKHVVLLSYQAQSTQGASRRGYISCFVIEVGDTWFLVTAGHVIRELQEAARRGHPVTQFRLHDSHAGERWNHPVPIHTQPEQWVVVDCETATQRPDYACTPLNLLYREALRVAGVQPIKEEVWGYLPVTAYDHLFLMGAPAETYSASQSSEAISIVMLELENALCPAGTTATAEDGRLFAVIKNDETGERVVNDIAGMSGGPIFGCRIDKDGAGLRYWLAGVQSSWYPTSRTLSYCEAHPFVYAVQAAARQLLG